MAGSTVNSHNSVEENLKLSTDGISYHHSMNNPNQEEDASAVATAVMKIPLQIQLKDLNTYLTQESLNQVLAVRSDSSSPDLFQLSRSSTLPNPSISFTNPKDTTPLSSGDLPIADTNFIFLFVSEYLSLYDILPAQPFLFWQERNSRWRQYIKDESKDLNGTKDDSISVVEDSVEHMKELGETLIELKMLMKNKKSAEPEEDFHRLWS
ncbi:hypothetical protein JCGZ_16912 [Jatropha curcas]|uniref:Uncharacterized protein n=1 Tax=Jatropha curcas TaxID=180498 RepID=A0A067LGC6_JATCU|nr:uncharacterized protein LOC110008894 [Jatropha curcas]KDP43625.1 hypothetical protein JCGZ_16912 [Jatropha curcas]